MKLEKVVETVISYRTAQQEHKKLRARYGNLYVSCRQVQNTLMQAEAKEQEAETELVEALAALKAKEKQE